MSSETYKGIKCILQKALRAGNRGKKVRILRVCASGINSSSKFNKRGSGVSRSGTELLDLRLFWIRKVVSGCGCANIRSLGVCGESMIG